MTASHIRSPAQKREDAARRAVGRARFHVLCRAAADGEDRDAAASRAGLSVAGMNTLLYRQRGTTAWPFAEERA